MNRSIFILSSVILAVSSIFNKRASADIFSSRVCQVVTPTEPFYIMVFASTTANSPADEFIASYLGVRARFHHPGLEPGILGYQTTQTPWYEVPLNDTPHTIGWVLYGNSTGFYQLQPGEHRYTSADVELDIALPQTWCAAWFAPNNP